MWKYGTILYWSEDDQAYIKGAIMADRIDIHPDICNGRPIIAGTRIPVQTIMEFLGAGDSIEEVLEVGEIGEHHLDPKNWPKEASGHQYA